MAQPFATPTGPRPAVGALCCLLLPSCSACCPHGFVLFPAPPCPSANTSETGVDSSSSPYSSRSSDLQMDLQTIRSLFVCPGLTQGLPPPGNSHLGLWSSGCPGPCQGRGQQGLPPGAVNSLSALPIDCATARAGRGGKCRSFSV